MSDIKPNLKDPDAVYKALIDLHEGLSEADSAALNARLILLLINQIGDESAIRRCLEASKRREPAL